MDSICLDRKSKQVVSYNIGPRTNATLNVVLETLRLSDAKRVYTDRLRNYRSLIETKIHRTSLYGTNHIERHNLTIRTHLKRLARKTICFSRSAVILSAILKIYGDKSIDVIYIIYTYCPIRTKCLLSSERRCSSNRIKG
ncbi:IS1 family transposase [Alistipes ihumii]|uniref:IS1 family transposase n=2 Tax=Alistipes ihumii TaxID=1470347 RepID=UPI003B5A483F